MSSENRQTSPQNISILASHLGKQVISGEESLTILDDLCFQAESGESVAIVGASGSGKSTLLALLAGLDEASTGHVELLGQNLTQLNEDERAELRRGRVGFVFQSYQLLQGLTAYENVLLSLELAGIDNASAQAHSALKQVGLAQRQDHYPAQLSGGEQQRVALARAYAPQPGLLFADEPTGNLDSRTGQQVSDLLFEMNSEYGATLILVTHDERLASRCGRVLEMTDGRLQHRSQGQNA